MRALRIAIAAVVLSHAAATFAGCPEVQLLKPSQGAWTTAERPEIVWEAVAGVGLYRLQVEAKIPEGAVVRKIDTFVPDTKFVLPPGLNDGMVSVKVSVHADCARDIRSVSGIPARFFWDVRVHCPMPKDLRFEESKLIWGAVPGATHYQVSIFSADVGRPVASVEVRDSYYTLPQDAPDALFVAVSSRCATSQSYVSFAQR